MTIEIGTRKGIHDTGPADPLVVVPYVEGMLRPETEAAASAWGGAYTLCALDAEDPYAYAKMLVDLWVLGRDTVVIEQDMVPAAGMVAALFACEMDWCTQAYHVGGGRFTTGLGFCKISHRIMEERPGAMDLAMRNIHGLPERVSWISVNEAFARQLVRYKYVTHEHPGRCRHLHYPGPADDQA